MAIIVNPTAAEFKQMLAEKKTFLAEFYKQKKKKKNKKKQTMGDAQLCAGGFC